MKGGEGRGGEEGPYSQADGENSCANPGEIAQRYTLSGLQSVGGRPGKTTTLQSIAPAGRRGALEEWEGTRSRHSTSIRTAAWIEAWNMHWTVVAAVCVRFIPC